MKKSILSLIMMFFLAFTICLTGCGKDPLKDNPPLEATVTSNGGMSVVKGDYLYFVNGYVDETTLGKKDNKEGKIKKGAIYRTKLDSNNDISKDKDGFLNNADLVVSKIVGFSNGGFQIIDNNIYYATPYMKLSSDGTLQNNRVEFHRININGTKDEVIHVTSSAEDKLDWTLYKVGNTVYLCTYEGGSIVVVNALNGKEVSRVENVTSYSFLEENDYIYNDTRTDFAQTHIYYTRAIDESDNVTNYSGNAVCTLNIATGEKKTLELSVKNTYTIKNVTRNAVYYLYTNNIQSNACLYKKAAVESWKTTTEKTLTNIAYDSYYFVDYGTDLIIATRDNSTWRLEGDANNEPVQLMTASRDVLGVFGDYGYYLSEGKLIRFNINEELGELQDAFNDKTTLITNSNFIDFDNRRIYVYTEYTAENGDTNYYLNYFNENYTSNDNFEQRFVGVFECDDVPAKPEQKEAEFEGDEVEYIPHID